MNLRVWRVSNRVGEFYAVKTPFEAAKLIRSLAESDLNNSLVTWNAFGLEVYEGLDDNPNPYDDDKNNWSEWYSKFGENIDEFADSLNISGGY